MLRSVQVDWPFHETVEMWRQSGEGSMGLAHNHVVFAFIMVMKLSAQKNNWPLYVSVSCFFFKEKIGAAYETRPVYLQEPAVFTNVVSLFWIFFNFFL